MSEKISGAAVGAHAGEGDELREDALLAGLFAFPRLRLMRGEGSFVWDKGGKRYLDFSAGLGVLALGHCHPAITRTMCEQAGVLVHTSHLYVNEPALKLADRLLRSSFASRVWFANSGTEANEAALKFARLHGRAVGGATKTEIVAFHKGFHGRTMGALAVTAEPAYREPFEPGLPGVRFAEYNDIESLRGAMNDNVCAVILEPVQGEGGVLPGTRAFAQAVREICDAHNALVILDEVQCGMGRTGTLYAYEWMGLTPDIMTLAKPLAGGLPLGATLFNDRVAQLLKPGQHGSTFSGGPLTCAVGNTVFDIVSAPAFLQRVRAAGEMLSQGLQQIVKRGGGVFESTRGVGLMQALLVNPDAGVTPLELVGRARERGLLATRAGKDAVRLLPPLICTDDEIAMAVDILQGLTAS